MTAYLLFLHLLNLVAPAVFLATLMVGLSHWMPGGASSRPLVQGWKKQWAWGLAVNILVLLAGLVFFRGDGKVATYGALVLASALTQWVLAGGWRR